MIFVYTTHANKDQAEDLCDKLLEERLIACYNLWPMQTAYWWKGKMEKGEEFIAILKTSLQNWSKIQARIKELHSYELPCIIKIEVEANAEYAQWIVDESGK